MEGAVKGCFCLCPGVASIRGEQFSHILWSCNLRWFEEDPTQKLHEVFSRRSVDCLVGLDGSLAECGLRFEEFKRFERFDISVSVVPDKGKGSEICSKHLAVADAVS